MTEQESQSRERFEKWAAKEFGPVTFTAIGTANALEMCAKAWQAAVREERQRCARIAEQEYADDNFHDYFRTAGQVIADVIRQGKGTR